MTKDLFPKVPKCLLLLCAMLIVSLWVHAVKIKNRGDRLYVYRYILTSKGATPSIERPQRFLSHKSIERRRRQGLKVDSTDLPISPAYINIFETNNTHVLGTSRWQQTVLVSSNDSLILEQLARLPMVKDRCCVYISPDSIEQEEDIRWLVREQFNRWDSVKNDPYGMARPQIESLQGVRLHEAGYRGKGITIAVIDAGFRGVDRIPAFQQTHVVGTHDFASWLNEKGGKPRYNEKTGKKRKGDNADKFLEGPTFYATDHGTKVFSALAAQAPEVIIGTAPEASYWLLRSEILMTEQPIEEDLWTMAAEFADSVGVDIINSSLGYSAYDKGRGNYSHEDLDGQTAFISRSASMLANKGIVLCNSAGNSGTSIWKKISVPADAPNIITVGAIDAEGQPVSFSSAGPTADGRVKPDVVARGSNTALLSGTGRLIHDMGTSFSTPIISGLTACLWQALPQLTAHEIIDLVRSSAHQYETPDSLKGYGAPDFWKAYNKALPSSSQGGDAQIEE